MFLLKRFRVRRNPEVLEIRQAKSWLECTHSANFVCYGYQPFIYVGTSQKGKYKRFHFYQKFDKDLVYIVLSDAEKNEIERSFRTINSSEYSYYDTICCNNEILHRFRYYSGKVFLSEAFMSEDINNYLIN